MTNCPVLRLRRNPPLLFTLRAEKTGNKNTARKARLEARKLHTRVVLLIRIFAALQPGWSFRVSGLSKPTLATHQCKHILTDNEYICKFIFTTLSSEYSTLVPWGGTKKRPIGRFDPRHQLRWSPSPRAEPLGRNKKTPDWAFFLFRLLFSSKHLSKLYQG